MIARGRGGLSGAVEVQLSLDDKPAGRPAPSRVPEAPLPKPPSRREWREEEEEQRRPGRSRERDYDDDHFLNRNPERRDREPNRGVLILVLGIISLGALVFWPLAPLWMILGVVAWVMGHKDLKKIKANQNGSGQFLPV